MRDSYLDRVGRQKKACRENWSTNLIIKSRLYTIAGKYDDDISFNYVVRKDVEDEWKLVINPTKLELIVCLHKKNFTR